MEICLRWWNVSSDSACEFYMFENHSRAAWRVSELLDSSCFSNKFFFTSNIIFVLKQIIVKKYWDTFTSNTFPPFQPWFLVVWESCSKCDNGRSLSREFQVNISIWFIIDGTITKKVPSLFYQNILKYETCRVVDFLYGLLNHILNIDREKVE